MSEPQLIHKAIISIMRETQAIKKDRRNEQQGYKFRGIDDIFNEVHPKFAEHGVFITPKVLESNREERQTQKGGNLIYTVMKIEFTFYAEDGSSVQCVMMGEGMDSGDKSCNKGHSVALKYAIMQILLIPTEDDKDPENDSPEVRPKAEKKAEAPKDWRNLPWHLPFGKAKVGNYSYKSQTLGEINANDPEGFAYWVKTFEPTPFKGKINEKDVSLRIALDMAREELGNASESAQEKSKQNSEVETPQLPKLDRQELLTALAGLSLENEVPFQFILELLKKKSVILAEVVNIEGCTTEILQQVHDNFKWFIEQKKKQTK